MLIQRFPFVLFSIMVSSAFGEVSLSAQECPFGVNMHETTGFHYSAAASSGAQGDIVALDLFLRVDEQPARPIAMALVVCYDHRVLELVRLPQISAVSVGLLPLTFIFEIGTEETLFRRPNGGIGFILSGGPAPAVAADIFPNHSDLHIATAYFRVIGEPGQSTEIEFCDDFAGVRQLGCQPNELVYDLPGEGSRSLRLISPLHRSATIEILDGPPTRTEIEDLPAEVRIYEERPDPAAGDVRFELVGGAVRPGGEAEAELFITSDWEWSGFTARVVLPAGVMLAGFDSSLVNPVAAQAETEGGGVTLAALDSWRRLGGEGERVRVGALRLAVSDALPVGTRLEIGFEDRPGPPAGVLNQVIVHYDDAAGVLPATELLSPSSTVGAIVAVSEDFARIGDANRDDAIDLSDAVTILNGLFVGGSAIACASAGDVNGNGRLEIGDAVAVLHHLFASGSLREGEAHCGD